MGIPLPPPPHKCEIRLQASVWPKIVHLDDLYTIHHLFLRVRTRMSDKNFFFLKKKEEQEIKRNLDRWLKHQLNWLNSKKKLH